MEFSIWLSGAGRTSCEICEQAYGEGLTPCYKCKPDLDKLNLPFFTLYQHCRDQYIMGPSGPVALDMLAVDKAMDYYNVDDCERILFSQKVRYIASIIINEQYEEQKAKREQERKGR